MEWCLALSILSMYNLTFTTMFYHNSFMVEPWIEYHKNLGVDHFILYYDGLLSDLERKDAVTYNKILEYCEQDLTTLIEWDIHDGNGWRPNGHMNKWLDGNKVRLWEKHRMHQFHDTLWKFGHLTRWVGNFDLDEFVITEKHGNITDFLSQYNVDEISHIRLINNWAELDGMSMEDYKKFNLDDLLKYDTLVLESKDRDGEIFLYSTSEGKYIYNPRNVIQLRNHHVEIYDETKEVIYLDYKDGSYLHYKAEWNESGESNLRKNYMSSWPTGHKNVWGHHLDEEPNYEVDEFIFSNWVLPKIGKKTILNNRIKDLIKGSRK
jgi:hypothetical protein